MKIIPYDKNKIWDKRLGYSKQVLMPTRILKSPFDVTQLQVTEISPGDHVGNHYHKVETEIICVVGGSGVFNVGGKEIGLYVNDVIIIEPEDIHSAHNNGDVPFLFLTYKLNHIDGVEDSVWL